MRCPSSEPDAATSASRDSHEISATPSYGSSVPRVAASAAFRSPPSECDWT